MRISKFDFFLCLDQQINFYDLIKSINESVQFSHSIGAYVSSTLETSKSSQSNSSTIMLSHMNNLREFRIYVQKSGRRIALQFTI